MLFVLCFVILFILELCYFKIAEHFSIIDRPNGRSSHTVITLRGGGIIFFLSVLLYFIFFGLKYEAFAIGLTALTIVSFADDIKHQPKRLRAVIQLLAVCLLLYETGLSINTWYLWPLGLLVVFGLLNAYNFMDGINGITTAYSFTVIASLFIINRKLFVFDERLLIAVATGNLVFAFFNFRKQARCFAGDVGSVGIAYILIFLTAFCVVSTGNPIFLLLFGLYIIDAMFTIAHRLYKRENIFEAHRQHLFQYLANEQKIPQLYVSLLYMCIQAVISAGVIYAWNKPVIFQVGFAVAAVCFPGLIYILAKGLILRQIEKTRSVVV